MASIIDYFLRGPYSDQTPKPSKPLSVGVLEDVGDFLPVYGDVTGVTDTAQAYSEGDYPLAAVLGAGTAVGAIPLVGDLASKGIKSAYKAIRGGKSAALSLNTINQREYANQIADMLLNRQEGDAETLRGLYDRLDTEGFQELDRLYQGRLADYQKWAPDDPIEMYRGTAKPQTSKENPLRDDSYYWGSSEPAVAQTYTLPDQGKVEKIVAERPFARIENAYPLWYSHMAPEEMKVISEGLLPKPIDEMGYWDWYDNASTDKYVYRASQNPELSRGVEFKNVIDTGSGVFSRGEDMKTPHIFPKGMTAEEVNKMPSTVYAMRPEGFRVPWARFDPRARDINHPLASIAAATGVGVGAAGMSQNDEQDILSYLAGLNNGL